MRRELWQRWLPDCIVLLVYMNQFLYFYFIVGLVWPRACLACPVGGPGGGGDVSTRV